MQTEILIFPTNPLFPNFSNKLTYSTTLELLYPLDSTAKCNKAQISADQLESQKLGISGTPSFVLGLTNPDDPSKVHLTKFIRGAQSLPTFAAAIDELLNSVEAEE